MSVGAAALGAFPVLGIALLAIGLTAAGSIVLDVVLTTVFQRLVPDELRGRAFGVLMTLNTVSAAVGAFVLPILVVERRRAAGARGVGGAILLALHRRAGTARWVDDAPGEPIRGDACPGRRAATLRRRSGGAARGRPGPRPAGRGRRPARSSSGRATPADRFFIIEDGTFARQPGGRIRQRAASCVSSGPDEVFGEIGLLNEAPRSATVAAETTGKPARDGRRRLPPARRGERRRPSAAARVVRRRVERPEPVGTVLRAGRRGGASCATLVTMAPPFDPYRTLGLAPGASLDEIRRAYRRLAKANHPDSAGEAALPRFLAIQAAYEMLTESRGRLASGGRRPVDARRGRGDAAAGPLARTPARGPVDARRGIQRSGTAGGHRAGGASSSGAARGSHRQRGRHRQRAGAGAQAASGRTGQTRRPGTGRRSPNKATLGSTSYDAAEDEPFEPEWAGGTWYGASSGTYWTLNPKEYADPRKHGPAYQRRARRRLDGLEPEEDGDDPSFSGEGFGGPESETAAGGERRREGFDGRWAYPDETDEPPAADERRRRLGVGPLVAGPRRRRGRRPRDGDGAAGPRRDRRPDPRRPRRVRRSVRRRLLRLGADRAR